MARARAERSRSKSAILEDIDQGIERLKSFLPQIEDLGQAGFPYLEGARVRTDLQLKECIRKTFGEKSPEFQTYRQHRLSVDTPADTKQTVGLIKSLIVTLEDKKLELQGLKPRPVDPSPAPPPAARPDIALVPTSTSTAEVTVSPAAPVIPPPRPTSVGPTTNPDMAQATVGTPLMPPAESSQPVVAPAPTPSSQAASISVAPPASLPPVANAAPTVPQAPRFTKPAASAVSVPVPPAWGERASAATTLAPAREPFVQLKSESPVSAQPAHDACETVKSLCKRFHMVARQLRLRGEYRATLDVGDEFDVQDLLHALLRLHFDDIETDEWLPSYSNGAPRIMFLLSDSRLAVVVKKTRTGLNAKDLADQLRIDVDHCRTLKRCSTLLCFVYDPEGRIGNPRGLEADLISISDQLTADVYVAPK